jgi:hypothetical protein
MAPALGESWGLSVGWCARGGTGTAQAEQDECDFEPIRSFECVIRSDSFAEKVSEPPFRLNRNGGSTSLLDAFSSREPASASLENALGTPRGEFPRSRADGRKIAFSLNKTVAPASSHRTPETHMPSKNERVELAMKIMKYRQLASRITDEELLERFAQQIADLEQKLREIDE